VEALKNADSYDRKRCQEYAIANFSADKMAKNYLKLYEKVLQGKTLHDHAPVVDATPQDKMLTMRE
jgi:hypothetical protein